MLLETKLLKLWKSKCHSILESRSVTIPSSAFKHYSELHPSCESRVRIYASKPLNSFMKVSFEAKSDLNSEFIYSKKVDINHIICFDNNVTYYLGDCKNEDFSIFTTWFNPSVMDINMKKSNSNKRVLSYKDILKRHKNEGLEASSKTYEYLYFNTLFADFEISDIVATRLPLYDLKFISTKFDVASQLQNSNFLENKDFVIINERRAEQSLVKLGYILSLKDHSNFDYATVYIDMNNIISVFWNRN